MNDEIRVAVFEFLGQQLWLAPQKAIFWKDKNALILADLHLGKVSHFRKSGIAIPNHVHDEDLARFDQLIAMYQPEMIIILGDLFHSAYNYQWQEFLDWKQQHDHIAWHLIKGNHDILPAALYEDKNMEVYADRMILAPFVFSHQLVMCHDSDPKYYNLTGHIHPGVKLQGHARQQLVLPCFYFGKRYGVLPAFGKFTGLALIKIKSEDQVFILAGKKVISADIPVGYD